MKTEIEKRAEAIGKEPAFPTSSLEGAFGDKGLTKLEWFVGMAMQGMLANPRTDENTMETIANHSMSLAHAQCMALAEREVANV